MDKLTRRQTEITSLICKGKSNQEIADRLNLSEGTVKVHVHSIFKRMKTKNRAELAFKVFKESPGIVHVRIPHPT